MAREIKKKSEEKSQVWKYIIRKYAQYAAIIVTWSGPIGTHIKCTI